MLFMLFSIYNDVQWAENDWIQSVLANWVHDKRISSAAYQPLPTPHLIRGKKSKLFSQIAAEPNMRRSIKGTNVTSPLGDLKAANDDHWSKGDK